MIADKKPNFGAKESIMRLCIAVLPIFFVLCGIFPLYAQDAPSEGESVSPFPTLQPYLNNQAEFEKRVRAFDKINVALAHAKYTQAKELEKEKETDKAKALSDEAQALLEQVKAAYELGLSHFQNSAVLHNYYGEFVHDFLGEPAQGAALWQKAIDLDNAFGRAHCNLGMFLLHNGKYEEGLGHVEKAIELEPENPDFMYNLIQVYLTHFPQVMRIKGWDRPRVYEEAMKLSGRTIALSPNDFELLRDHATNYFLAKDFGAQPDWNAAAKAWQDAREHARNEAERFNTWLNEARVHIRAGKDKKARKCLEQADKIMPNNDIVQTLMDDLKK